MTVITLGYDNFLTVYLYVLSGFVLLFSSLDLVIHFWLKSKRVSLDLDLQIILENFSFINKKKDIAIFTSPFSPVVMNIGFFQGNTIILNKKVISQMSPRELRALLDYELYFGDTIFGSFEQLLQRLYVMTYYPLEKLMSYILPKYIVSYFLSPSLIFYKSLVKICRENYVYNGRYKSDLDQIFFKIKATNFENKFELFSYAFSLRNSDLTSESHRFENNEIFKW